MSSANVNASENAVSFMPLSRFSQMPMMNAPMTAPGIDPIPPKTAATKPETRHGAGGRGDGREFEKYRNDATAPARSR